jgi:hypothetical protein
VPGVDSEVVVSAVAVVASAAGEVPLEEDSAAVDGVDLEEDSVAGGEVSERRTGCTCFSFVRLFLCFLSLDPSPHCCVGNVYDIYTSKNASGPSVL